MSKSHLLKKVLISDVIDPCCAEILRDSGIEVDIKVGLSHEQLKEEIKKYDGLILRSATFVTADILEVAENMKVAAFAGTGTDNVDIKAASKHGIIVMNAPGANTVSTAEHTCAMICTLVRNIPKANMSMKAGKWETEALTGIALQGRTLAVIGLGAIGREVIKRMKAFQMNIIGYDPIVTKQQALKLGVTWYPLEEIWPRADIITLHLPAIPQTYGMINDSVFAQCRQGMYLVNAARGTIVREQSVLKALEKGICAGAALDVFQEEPTHNEELVNHPNVIATPHIGGNTTEAQTRVAANVANQFVNLNKCIKLSGNINVKALQDDLQAWHDLGHNLGHIAATYVGHLSGQTQVQVETCGDSAKGGARFLKYAVEKGLITVCQSSDKLQDAGVQVSTGHNETCSTLPCDMGGGMKVTVTQGDRSLSLCGTVRGSAPLLCAINGCAFTNGTTLQGNMLFYESTESNSFLPLSVLSSNGKSTVSAFASSATVGVRKWTVIYLNELMDNIEPIKSLVACLMQITVPPPPILKRPMSKV
ncbi:D-3-phosphoglycerate dehydrogenase-like [Ptychodera flava]|uniref:D-3-phosphoglycerate dehydrogenase-like n=1 Tax=Ptychodera flava TaxID=63121 RepID=UPI00396A1D2D